MVSKMTKKAENKPEKNEIKVVIREDQDFKRIPVSGVFGTLNPLEGRMGFFLDSVVPGLKNEYSTEMEPKELERRMMTEIKMSPQTFLQITEWMNKRVAEFREDFPNAFQKGEE